MSSNGSPVHQIDEETPRENGDEEMEGETLSPRNDAPQSPEHPATPEPEREQTPSPPPHVEPEREQTPSPPPPPKPQRQRTPSPPPQQARSFYEEAPRRTMDPVETAQEMKRQYMEETKLLRSSNLEGYMRSTSLHSLGRQSNSDLDRCAQHFKREQEQVAAAITTIAEFHELLLAKIKSENLDSWIDKSKLKDAELNEEVEALKLEMRLCGAEQKHRAVSIALAASETMEALTTAEECLVQCGEKVVKGKEKAVKARVAYEEAKRAEEEKRRLEEEARRKAEERRRQQEEEERRRKEEEERRHREFDMQKKTMTPEEFERYQEEQERKEREKRNPKNWPRYVYNVEGGEFEHGIGCIVRAMEGDIRDESHLSCRVVNQLDNVPSLHPTEEIVSNIICISPAGLDSQFSFQESWSVALPHCSSRNPAREPIIMSLQPDNSWRELPSSDVHFDDFRETAKFAEARVSEPSVTLVVVSKVKTDRFQVGKKGTRINSSVDSRICVVYPPGALRINLDMSLQVQPLEASFLMDMKMKHSTETANVITTSHIITFNTVKKKVFKPVSFCFTVPLNPAAKKTRPGTAMPDKARVESSGRPKTAFAGSSDHDDALEEELHILRQTPDDNKWKEWKTIELMTQKNKDIVCFDVDTTESMRFFAMRTKPNVSEENLIRVAQTFERAFTFRTVHLLLRQKTEDQTAVALLASPSNRLERNLRSLSEEGFDDDGLPPSAELIFQERQVIEVRFRGNVRLDDSGRNSLKLVYNSQLKNRLDFFVTEVDKYAQKAIECYRGFTQIFTKELVKKPAPKEEGQVLRKGAPQFIWVEEDQLLCELLVNIPKAELDICKPLMKASFHFKSSDCVDQTYLRQLSQDLGDEWKVLAQRLGMRRARIQAIQRNNVGKDPEEMVLDMFLTWVKKLPTSAHKPAILVRGLNDCGRPDLAEDLRDRDNDFRRTQADLL